MQDSQHLEVNPFEERQHPHVNYQRGAQAPQPPQLPPARQPDEGAPDQLSLSQLTSPTATPVPNINQPSYRPPPPRYREEAGSMARQLQSQQQQMDRILATFQHRHAVHGCIVIQLLGQNYAEKQERK